MIPPATGMVLSLTIHVVSMLVVTCVSSFSSGLSIKQAKLVTYESNRGVDQCADNQQGLISTREIRSKIECSLLCQGTAGCGGVNWKEPRTCEMFSVVTRFKTVVGCSFVYPGNTCPYTPPNCSFPFTYSGQLYHRCMLPSTSTASSRSGNTYQCISQGTRNLMTCSQPCSGFVAINLTISASIPTFPGSIPVISVNNWIVWQQRIDSKTNFSLGWNSYRDGFGVYNRNYWMGLEKVYQMTSRGSCRLRFELLNDLNQWLSVEYDSFYLDNERLQYAIHVAGYSGDMIYGDPICNGNNKGSWYHNGMPFSTNDNDHNLCSSNWGGRCGWWFNNCHSICLNGPYNSSYPSPVPAFGYDDYYSNAQHWHALIASRMMIKCN